NQLERGETDLALMAPGDSRFAWRLLFPLNLFAVVPQGHRLPSARGHPITALAGAPRLLLPTRFRPRASVRGARESAPVTPRVRCECAAAHALIGPARADYGVAVVPSIALVEDKSLRAVPIVVRGAAIGHWAAVCWDPRRLAPAYVDAFVSELAAY